MTAKFDAFKAALNALCLQHAVEITPSMYDAIEFWDLDPGGKPINWENVVNRTKGRKMPNAADVGRTAWVLVDGKTWVGTLNLEGGQASGEWAVYTPNHGQFDLSEGTEWGYAL